MVGPDRLAAHIVVTPRLATYPPGATFGPRTLGDFELVWLLSGSVRWAVTGRDPVAVHPGELLLSTPGQVDLYQWDPDVTCTHAYVHFRCTGPLPAAVPPRRDFHSLPVLAALCDHLLDLGAAEAPRRLADQVLTTLLEIFLAGVPAGHGPLPGPLERMIDHVRDVWRSDGMRIIAVDELAEHAQVSAAQVFRLFARQWGLGPAQALEHVRLSRAGTTLQRSDATIAQVAELCGYTNPYHFSRRFKSVFGLAPSEFRTRRTLDPLQAVRAAGLLDLLSRTVDPRDG